MTFASPYVLLGLLLLAVLAGGYLAAQRARRQAALAFASATLAASVIPHRPGARRHVPSILFAGALAALVVAAAGPRVNLSVAVGRLSIMLATDVSGSMRATDIAPNRVTAAQSAADAFVTASPSSVRVGIMEFNEHPLVLALPGQDHLALYAALGRLRTGGGTAIGSALNEALGVLGAGAAPERSSSVASGAPTRAIVLLSDGYSTSGPDPLVVARQSARLRIPIFTVALGTPGGTITVSGAHGRGSVTRPVPPDPQALSRIALLSGGRPYTVADARRLSQVYRQLGSQLGHTSRRREVTVYFAGAGLLLLMLGSALSLHWFGRLI